MAIFIGFGFSGHAAQIGTAPPPTVGAVAQVAPLPVANAVFDSGAARGENAADIPLSGSTDAPDGAQIEVRIVRADTRAEIHPWAVVATASGGTWAGSYPDATRSPHWLKAQVRVQGETAVAETGNSFAVGHVWAIWEQSNWTRLLVGGGGSFTLDAPAVTHPDDVQLWKIQRNGGTTTPGTVTSLLVNDATAAADEATPSMVAFANTLTAARPGEKFAILAHTVSGTSPISMIDPSDLSRKWPDEVLLHDTATAHGTQVGAALNAGWIAWEANGLNAQKMVPIMTQKMVDGTPLALGDTVPLGGESFVLHHSMTEIYDLSYTKMGFIGPHGRAFASNTFSYTTFAEIDDPAYEAIGTGWAAVQADKANFPEMLDYQWETTGALRGKSDGAGGWMDTAHHSAQDVNGLQYLAQIGANHMLRATGLATFDAPEITHSDWTATHIDLWNPDHDITTKRNLAGGTSSFVRGFVFDGQLVTTEAQLVANAGGSGRQGIRITPAGGVTGAEILDYGRGRQPGLTVGPDDFIDNFVLDLPVMDVGQTGAGALPVVSRTTFESNLAGVPFFAWRSPGSAIEDPNTIGAGVTGITIRGDIRPYGATVFAFASGSTFVLRALADGRARLQAGGFGTFDTAATVFLTDTFTEFVWTLDFDTDTTTIWWGSGNSETFTLTGDGTELPSGRNISLLHGGSDMDVRFIDVWKAATTTRDTTGLGVPHKRIEADASGDPVQVPLLPSW